MNKEEFRIYCLSKKGVTESFPFGPEVLVFKVLNKLFALTSLDAENFSVNLKMDAELVPEFRERYEAVQPGFHMNKKHWNTVYMESGRIPRKEIIWIIDHSYDEVVKGLPKKLQKELEEM